MARNITFTEEVFCRTRFSSFHYWREAPEKFKYLSYPHRHEFHVEVVVEVKNKDRDVEFIDLKDKLDNYIRGGLMATQTDPTNMSCEAMAWKIGLAMYDYGYKVARVEVSEDGENGARVTFEKIEPARVQG